MPSNEKIIWYVESIDTADEGFNSTHTPFQNARFQLPDNAAVVGFVSANAAAANGRAVFAVSAYLHKDN